MYALDEEGGRDQPTDACSPPTSPNWVDTSTEKPTPFVWHEIADQILERLAGHCTIVNQGTDT